MTLSFRIFSVSAALVSSGAVLADDAEIFKNEILPALDNYCFDCHEPGLSKGGVEFLNANEVGDIQSMRAVWRSVGSQIKNRTMPPPDKKNQPTDEERERLAGWIDGHLKKSALEQEPYAGRVRARRLNRLEYDNTVRDLVGVDLNFSETFPMDGGTGEGFDNNGESLFLQPMLMERYLESAGKIVDAAIVSPRLLVTKKVEAMLPKQEGQTRRLDFSKKETNRATAMISVFTKADYAITARILKPKTDEEKRRIVLRVDGLPAHRIVFDPAKDDQKGDGVFLERKVKVKLARGAHALEFSAGKESKPVELREMWMSQDKLRLDDEQKRIHKNLLRVEVGTVPEKPRESASKILKSFTKRAFRRPVRDGELEKFLALYDRADQRGDPWEERMKLALKGVLVSPAFLFRLESPPTGEGIQLLDDHELATRLSYFLWASMPDAELIRIADSGKLREPEELEKQFHRMLDDKRSAVFADNFMGQWLGTKDVGGRVAPITNELQKKYTPDLAANMRAEPVLLFHHIVTKNRPVTELIDAKYTFVTRRLGELYQLKDWQKLPKDNQKKIYVGERRGGVLGMASVLALTSHYKKTSPVLRGAWVFDTLIGDPVPPPPADVPELVEKSKDGKKLTDRQKIEMHRDQPDCMACHQLIDPIGFALQNYDFLGQWREQDQKKAIEPTGVLPSGEKFTGPRELKAVLLKTRRSEFYRQITRKLLGYSLGRSLTDKDDGTIEKLVRDLEQNEAGGRELVKSIVMSVPFRNQEDNSE